MSEGMEEKAAEVLSQQYNIVAMIIFCASRFICTFILRYLSPGLLLKVLAIVGLRVYGRRVIGFQNIWGMYCPRRGISLYVPSDVPHDLRYSFTGIGAMMPSSVLPD